MRKRLRVIELTPGEIEKQSHDFGKNQGGAQHECQNENGTLTEGERKHSSCFETPNEILLDGERLEAWILESSRSNMATRQSLTAVTSAPGKPARLGGVNE